MNKNYSTIAIVGNPNTGKTTLFNSLTGEKQKVGNWAGVTVDIKRGDYCYKNTKYQIVDLPGCYSLVVADDKMSKDEQLTCEYLLSNDADIILNLIDKNNLARNLYLTLQLLEHDRKVIVVLDEHDAILEQLAINLGCPVVRTSDVRQAIANYNYKPNNNIRFSSKVTQVVNSWLDKVGEIFNINPNQAKGMIIQALEGDILINQTLLNNGIDFEPVIKFLDNCFEQDIDIVLAKQRHDYICELTSKLNIKNNVSKIKNNTWKIDKWVLNRFLGIPIFLFVMYLMFVFSLNISSIFQGFFDIASQTIFIDGMRVMLEKMHAPSWFIYMAADGMGRGINTTISFIPVLGAMFFALAFLESSGYMARAAFVVDRAMQYLGLPGKSFVSMIVGFGCNVPAVMASRTLEHKRERLITIMMSPFMSCGARLAIFSVFVAAFFPSGGHNVIFALYVIGILVAIFTGFVLKVEGDGSALIMELPVYRFPDLKVLFRQAMHRLKKFLVKAGTLIVPLCIVFSAFGPIGRDYDRQSPLEYIGKKLTPLFKPMGITEDNWPATLSLITGVVAKEVVVGSLNSLYSNEYNSYSKLEKNDLSQNAHDKGEGNSNIQISTLIKDGMLDAVYSIPNRLKSLSKIWTNPFAISLLDKEVDDSVFGVMYQKFQGKLAAFSYLLFILLYFPCVSVIATVSKELSKRWALFAIAWPTILAYTVAVTCYQLGTIYQNPLPSILWSIILSSFLGLFIFIIRKFMNNNDAGKYKPLPTRIISTIN